MISLGSLANAAALRQSSLSKLHTQSVETLPEVVLDELSSISTKQILLPVVDAVDPRLDDLVRKLESNDKAGLTLVLTQKPKISSFMRPILFHLIDRSLDLSIITTHKLKNLSLILDKLSFLLGTGRIRVFVTSKSSGFAEDKKTQFIQFAIKKLHEGGFQHVPTMIYAPSIQLADLSSKKHKHLFSVFDKKREHKFHKTRRDEARFKRFFAHTSLLWVQDKHKISENKGIVRTLRDHGTEVYILTDWKDVQTHIEKYNLKNNFNPFLRIVTSLSDDQGKEPHLKLIQALRPRLNVRYPLLVYEETEPNKHASLYQFDFVKAVSEPGEFMRFGLMKPLLWAPDQSKGLMELTDDWRGDMTVYDVCVSDVSPSKHSTHGQCSPMCLMTISNISSLAFKSKPQVKSPTAVWHDLNWNCMVTQDTTIKVTVMDWTRFHSPAFVGCVQFTIQYLTRLLANDGTMCIEKTFQLGNDERHVSNMVTGTLTLTLGFKTSERPKIPAGEQPRRRRRKGSVKAPAPGGTLGSGAAQRLLMKKRNKRRSYRSSVASLLGQKRGPHARLKRYFGVTLEESISRALRDGKTHVVEGCCTALVKKGFNLEGLVRTPGNRPRIYQLKQSIETQQDVNFSAEDPYDLVGLLKLYLMEMPDSLIPEVLTRILSLKLIVCY